MLPGTLTVYGRRKPASPAARLPRGSSKYDGSSRPIPLHGGEGVHTFGPCRTAGELVDLTCVSSSAPRDYVVKLPGNCKVLLAIISAATLTFYAATPAVADNEALCNQDITKSVKGLRNAYAKVSAKCVKRGFLCSLGTYRVSVKMDDLRKKVSGQGSACYAAVTTDGASVSDFGPGATCPSSFSAAATETPIVTLEDLAECLIQGQRTYANRLIDRLQLRDVAFFSYEEKNEAKCINKVYRSAVKAWKSAAAQVARCAKGGVKPFACSLDLSDGSKFSRALDHIDKRVAACKDAAGVVGGLSGDVLRRCHRHISEPADLVGCVREAAICVSCRDTNALYELGQDCAVLAQSRTCDKDVAVGAMAVTNEGDDTATLYDPTGNYLFGTLATSSVVVGSDPSAAVFNSLTNTLMVANRGDDSVTFLVGTTGDYVNGSLLASTFPVGNEPVSLAINPDLGLLYVANRGDNSVVILDAFDGQPAFGTLLDSTVAVGSQPSAVAFAPDTETVIVANEADSSLVLLNGVDGSYVGGGLGSATHPTIGAPVDVIVEPNLDVVVVASEADQAVAYHDPATGLPRYGTLPASTVSLGFPVTDLGGGAKYRGGPSLGFWGVNMVSGATDTLVSLSGIAREHPVVTGSAPVAVEAHGASTYAFVVERGDETLTTYDPGDSFAASRFFGENGRASLLHRRVAVNEANDTAYLLSDDSGSVTFFEAISGGYKFGTLAASTFDVGNGASSIAVGEAHDRLYVVNSLDDTVTYLNATTGAYIGGSLAAASIAIGPSGRSIAVNDTDGLVYVSNGSSSPQITYLDASMPAYLGGSLGAASVAMPHESNGIDVDPAAGIVYSVGSAYAVDSLVMLDATTPAFFYGTLAASRFDTGARPYAVAVNPSANLLFIGTSIGTLYLDATTGAQIAGTPTSDRAYSYAADPAAGLLYATGAELLWVLDFNSTAGYISGAGPTSRVSSPGFVDISLHKGAGLLWGADHVWDPALPNEARAVVYDVNTMSFAFSDAAPVQSVSTGPLPTSLAVAR